MKIVKLVFAGTLVLVFGAGFGAGKAYAHGGAKGVVKERMEAMGGMADAMKTVGGMIRGKMPYNAAKLEAASATLEQHGGEALTRLFPEGSLMQPSEAKEEIWQDWAAFKALADDLKSKAGVLSKVSGNGSGLEGSEGGVSVPQAFGMVGKTCTACHQKFRVKKD